MTRLSGLRSLEPSFGVGRRERPQYPLRGALGRSGSNDYAGTISALDKDGIRNGRLIPEMAALMERTQSINSKVIGNELLWRHKDEWEEIRKANDPKPVRNPPTKKVHRSPAS